MTLRVHSLESFGTLDGPGVRFVVFLQGCPLRCRYCHNPDTWAVAGGTEMTTEELMRRIRSCKSFLRNGGVTISGGEPLMQAKGLTELLNACRNEGFHCAIDTAGSLPMAEAREPIDAADMLLLDIKSLDDGVCRALTGRGNGNTLATLDYCEETGKRVWIRHVVVPGWTLDDDALRKLGTFLAQYRCVEKVELLAFHKMAQVKYAALGMADPLENTPTPTPEAFARAQKILAETIDIFHK